MTYFRFGLHIISNEDEYEALIAGLKLAKSVGATKIIIKIVSQLMVNQVKGICNAENLNMAKYRQMIINILPTLEYFQIKQLPQEANTCADVLASLVSATGID